MLVACLWSHWQDGEDSLLSFGAITDEPPTEIAAAGRDRCIIPIERQNLDAWLDPKSDLQAAYRILDDRWRPYYEHRLAAQQVMSHLGRNAALSSERRYSAQDRAEREERRRAGTDPLDRPAQAEAVSLLV